MTNFEDLESIVKTIQEDIVSIAMEGEYSSLYMNVIIMSNLIILSNDDGKLPIVDVSLYRVFN